MPEVKPIPAGYHSVTPFLNLKNCAEAMEFFKKAFGAEERSKMPDAQGRIMHAEMKIGDSIIMLSDAMERPEAPGSLFLYVNDVDAAFDRAVKAGAKVEVPLADMFWGDRWGALSDSFGNKWQMATHREDVPPADMAKRAAEAMKAMQPKS